MIFHNSQVWIDRRDTNLFPPKIRCAEVGEIFFGEKKVLNYTYYYYSVILSVLGIGAYDSIIS